MHFQRLAAIVVSSVAFVVGCDTASKTPCPVGLAGWFQVYLYQNDQFVNRVGEGYQAVPGKWMKLKLPNRTEVARFRVLDVDRKSVKFAVSCSGVEKIGLTNNRHNGKVNFSQNDSVLKFSVDAGGSVPPFSGEDLPFKDQFTMFRIQPWIGGEHDEKYIKGRRIVETQLLNSRHAVAALNKIMSYSEQLS